MDILTCQCPVCPAASTWRHGCEPSLENATHLLACRTGCMELTAIWHSFCSQPCHVQKATQNALFNTAFFTC